MALTTDQYTALKNAILADPVLSLLPASNINSQTIADAFNAAANPAANAWDKSVLVDRIHNTIDDTKYTPSDAPDGTLLFQNRSNVIIIKQMNLQTKILGRATLDATQPLLRTALKDATTAVPAGASGANVNPGGSGGVNVLNACLRPKSATRFEKVLSAGSQTTGSVTAEVLTYEGAITRDDVQYALGW